MAKSNLPFSVLTKLNDLESGQDGDGKKMLTKEEFKKTKELEEARKAGTAPAQVDEEGKDINPHIPSYISVTPWYFGSTGPTLKHQRPQEEKAKFFNSIKDHYVRGLQGPKANKYRKGACENCGAMGHKKKECFERPRKVGAKYKSEKICPDDVVLPDLAMDYDGKRDRWNGFNPVDYTAVIDEHQKLEDYKHQLKAQKLRDGEEINEDEPDDDDEDDEKYADHIDMPGTKVDGKQRITVRNLRIREDTAKYLRNLDPNSAYYDPKSRSMRENPYIGTGKKSDEVDFAGENFVRFSGDTINHAKTQLFAWEAYEKGVDVSLLAEPTKLELLKKEFIKKKEEYKGQVSGDLLEKYGGKEHLDVPPPELLLAQTENYVEYSRLGKVIKGTEVQIVLSKYEEDIFPNNHMSVWGSYWRDGNWGYKCCHSFIKNSYCTGEAGRTTDLPVAVEVAPEPVEVEEEKTLLEMHTDKMETKKKKKSKRKKKALKKESSSSSSDSSSDESDEEQKEEKRKKKLREALIRAKLEEEQGTAEAGMDDRERKYNTKYENKTLTEEDIEAYQIRRVRDDDPMAAFMNKS